jgi:hypothetical protein
MNYGKLRWRDNNAREINIYIQSVKLTEKINFEDKGYEVVG